MRITKISVKGLFGMFDHEIPLNQESRITIVHGPNGVGKTIVLRLIQDLFGVGFSLLYDIPFDQFRIDFGDGASIIAQRTAIPRQDQDKEDSNKSVDLALGRTAEVARNLQGGPSAKVLIHFEDATGTKHPPFEPPYAYAHHIPSALEDHPDIDLQLVGKWVAGRGLWVDEDSEEAFTDDDLFTEYPQLFSYYYDENVDWYRIIKADTNTQLIRTQRSWPDDKGLGPYMHAIYTDEDADYMHEKALMSDDFAFSWLAFRVRASFGNLHQKRQDALDSVAKFDATVGEFSQSLRDLSLFEVDDVDELESAEAEILEMRESLQNMLKNVKTKDYNFVRQRLIFEELINERFLFKTVKLDPQEGIKVVSGNGDDIQLAELSSGEQHLLILYYRLLFDIESDTLIMIDEPEISLNVVWQRNFLKDLQRIVELRKFDVLIATHSPEIIYDKWDWTVALGEKASD